MRVARWSTLVAFTSLAGCGARTSLQPGDEESSPPDDGPECSADHRDFLLTGPLEAMDGANTPPAVYWVAPSDPDGRLWIAGSGKLEAPWCNDGAPHGQGPHFIARVSVDFQIIEEWRFNAGEVGPPDLDFVLTDTGSVVVFSRRGALGLPSESSHRRWSMAALEGAGWRLLDSPDESSAQHVCAGPNGRLAVLSFDSNRQVARVRGYSASLAVDSETALTAPGGELFALPGCVFLGEDLIVAVTAKTDQLQVDGTLHPTSRERLTHLVRVNADGQVQSMASFPVFGDPLALAIDAKSRDIVVAGEHRGGSFGTFDLPATESGELLVMRLDVALDHVRWVVTTRSSDPLGRTYPISRPNWGPDGTILLTIAGIWSVGSPTVQRSRIDDDAAVLRIASSGKIETVVTPGMTRVEHAFESPAGLIVAGRYTHPSQPQLTAVLPTATDGNPGFGVVGLALE